MDTNVPTLIHGRTWEEMTPGFAFRTGARTITEADLVSFVSLTGRAEPLFYDTRFATDHGYAGRLVPGMQTFCYAEGLVIQTGSIHGTGLAHLHCEIDIKGPVYVGDTIFGPGGSDRAAGDVEGRSGRDHDPQHRVQPARRGGDGVPPGAPHQGP